MTDRPLGTSCARARASGTMNRCSAAAPERLHTREELAGLITMAMRIDGETDRILSLLGQDDGEEEEEADA